MAINQLPELTTAPVLVVLYEDESEMVHTPQNGYRCSDSTCPCAADAMEQETPDAMAQSEAWLARQAAQHEEDRNYFSQWGMRS